MTILVGIEDQHLVTINPTTGAVTQVGSSSIPQGIVLGAEDVENGNLYYITMENGAAYLVTVNESTGQFTSVPTTALNFVIDLSTGKLVGIDGQNLVTINPTTGAVTQVGSSTIPQAVFLGAEDAENGNFYYITPEASGVSYLVTVSESTGQFTSVPTTASNFVIDLSTGKLVGIDGQNLVTINPTTDIVTQVGSSAIPQGVLLGAESAAYGNFYYVTGNPANGTQNLVTVNESTGQFTSVPTTASNFVIDPTWTPIKLGSTILVEASDHTQLTPSIAALANNQFIVGWEDWTTGTGGSYSNYGIRAEYFNANGDPSIEPALTGDQNGSAFHLVDPAGLHPDDKVGSPDLIGLANGSFSAVFTWFSENSQNTINQYSSPDTIDPISTNLSSGEFGGADNPSQAQLTNGTTVVAWDQDMVTNQQTNTFERVIYADIVTTGGVIVNTNRLELGISNDDSSLPSVSALADGGFVITWQDTTDDTVWMQLYDASGNPVGTSTQVPAHNSGTQSAPAVAGLPDGQYVVAYVDTSGAYSGDSSGSAIVARVFNADGGAVADFLVDTTSSGDQTEPAIVALADGRFFVAWLDASGAGGAGTDIRGQLFKPDGSGGYIADGSEMLIDTPGGNQASPSLAVTPDGRILVSWQTTNAPGGSGIDVQMLDPREHGMVFNATAAADDSYGNVFADQFYGTAYNDLVYARADTVFDGGGGFNTLIEKDPNVTIDIGAGTTLDHVQEVILANSGCVIDASHSSDFIYLYGYGVFTNTMTLGSGGGYEISTGATNHMYGGASTTATDVFIGLVGPTENSDMHGGAGINDYYVGANDTVSGAGLYNTLIELAQGVTLDLGSSGVQQVLLNGGTNSVDMTGSTDFDYLYGGSGTNTMTLGSGGGYELSTGGTNHMFGGSSGTGTDVFIGGIGMSDMHGGNGDNDYYVGANDTVAGAGTYNTLIEEATGVDLVLGSPELTNVQQFILDAGNNTVDASSATWQVFLYGGAGNDTLIGGRGSDYLYGGAGTNTFQFDAVIGANKTGWGQDTIMDWTAGTNNQIDLTSLAVADGVHGIADLTQTITGGNDVITSSHTGTESITLVGVGSALTASSFHFA